MDVAAQFVLVLCQAQTAEWLPHVCMYASVDLSEQHCVNVSIVHSIRHKPWTTGVMQLTATVHAAMTHAKHHMRSIVRHQPVRYESLTNHTLLCLWDAVHASRC
jgi:hypothetical protein